MVVEVGDVLLPLDLVSRSTVVHLDGEVSSVVVPSEVAGWVAALLVGTCFRGSGGASWDRLVKGEGLSAETMAFLEDGRG